MFRWISLSGAALLCVLLFSGCSRGGADDDKALAGKKLPEILLSSPAFEEGGRIPTRYTCDDENVSPALDWENPPEGAKAFALICDDPDAPGKVWVHWVLYDIPAETRNLPEAIDALPELEGGMMQGTNDQHNLGYGGPCPPPGKPHRYYFKLYVLDAPTGLLPGAQKMDLLKAIKGHVIAKGQLMGLYQRG